MTTTETKLYVTPFKLGPFKQGQVILDAEDNWVCTAYGETKSEAEQGAQEIIRTCNAHYDLLEACQLALALLNAEIEPQACPASPEATRRELRAAIAKATGGQQ